MGKLSLPFRALAVGVAGLLVAVGGSAGAPSAAAGAPAAFTVTVTGGYGGGTYTTGTVVHVWSAASTVDAVVRPWSGDADLLADPMEWHSTFVMPAHDVNLVANSNAHRDVADRRAVHGRIHPSQERPVPLPSGHAGRRADEPRHRREQPLHRQHRGVPACSGIGRCRVRGDLDRGGGGRRRRPERRREDPVEHQVHDAERRPAEPRCAVRRLPATRAHPCGDATVRARHVGRRVVQPLPRNRQQHARGRLVPPPALQRRRGLLRRRDLDAIGVAVDDAVGLVHVRRRGQP